MRTKRIILAAILSSSMVGLGAQPGPKPSAGVRLKPGMAVREQVEEQRRQKKEWNKKYMDLMEREAWKNFLKITAEEWNVIEPGFEKVRSVGRQTHSLTGGGGGGADHFHWIRPSESMDGPMEGKPRDQMPQSHRIEEELIDLLEDPNSTDTQIRQKIDALQQARENARKALPEAKQELAKVLTTTRQEAVFLLTGYID